MSYLSDDLAVARAECLRLMAELDAALASDRATLRTLDVLKRAWRGEREEYRTLLLTALYPSADDAMDAAWRERACKLLGRP